MNIDRRARARAQAEWRGDWAARVLSDPTAAEVQSWEDQFVTASVMAQWWL